MNHATTQDLKVTKAGEETAEFYFTANPGEESKPLREIASGGELSRLMLLIKHVTAPTLFPRTLIFDEIDAGIGGRVADSVGAKLHRVARSNQVLCVTHQAQIARYADAHFLVRKRIDGARTRTHIDELKEAERVDELARMLGGNEVTSLARRHARELLRQR
jgi:DNA repair protein RecN (Recombination protein N)